MRKAPERIENKSQFAERVQLSKARVSQLVARGLPLTPDGRVRVVEALRWLRENIATESGRPSGSFEGSTGNGAAEELETAKIRLTLAQAERAEMENAVRRGELVSKQEVIRAGRAVTRTTRDMFMNFSARHGAEIASELAVDPGTLIGLLESHIRQALNEAADQPMPDVDGDDE